MTGVQTCALPISDGAGYTAEVYVNGYYYQVTLDKANGSYTFVKPEAVITFDLGGKGENFTRNQNLNINLDLRGDEIAEPVAEGFIFKGWYEGEGGTGSRVWDIKPQTTDPITVYAKWAAAYTVTLVYNDGSADGKLVAEENTTVSLDSQKPANDFVDGKYFFGWCQDEELTTPITSFTITGNTTVYAKWVGAAEYTVTAKPDGAGYGFDYKDENGYYVSTNQGAGNTESKMTLTVTSEGVLKFSYQSSGESNYDYLYIKVNGEEKASAKGKDNTSGMSVGSEPKADKWVDFSIAVKEGDIIEIIYKKDGSGDRGADTGWVKL